MSDVKVSLVPTVYYISSSLSDPSSDDSTVEPDVVSSVVSLSLSDPSSDDVISVLSTAESSPVSLSYQVHNMTISQAEQEDLSQQIEVLKDEILDKRVLLRILQKKLDKLKGSESPTTMQTATLHVEITNHNGTFRRQLHNDKKGMYKNFSS